MTTKPKENLLENVIIKKKMLYVANMKKLKDLLSNRIQFKIYKIRTIVIWNLPGHYYIHS